MGLKWFKKKKESASDTIEINDRSEFIDALNSYLLTLKLAYPAKMNTNVIEYWTEHERYSQSSHQFELFNYKLSDYSFGMKLSFFYKAPEHRTGIILVIKNSHDKRLSHNEKQISLAIEIMDRARDALSEEVEKEIVSMFGGPLFTTRDFVNKELNYYRERKCNEYQICFDRFIHLTKLLEGLNAKERVE